MEQLSLFIPEDYSNHVPNFVPGWNSAKAQVKKVIFDGLGRTKNDLVLKLCEKELFTAKSLEEIAFACGRVKYDLLQLKIFREVLIEIDTAKGKNVSKDAYTVTFRVKEQRRVAGALKTEVGNNETGLRGRLYMPNICGRGEVASMDFVHNFIGKDTGGGIKLSKPLNANPNVILSGGFTQYKGLFPWSGFTENTRGFSADLNFLSALGVHNVMWEGVWRDVRAATKTTSYEVREQSGHSLKSSVKHSIEKDMRDDNILPTSGPCFKATQEFAGLGGNVEFLKNEMMLQLNKRLILDTSLQLSLAGGIMKPLGKNKDVHINDRFFLGGPQTLRGFHMRGVGKSSEGNALGGTAYWLAGLHLFTPLPFRLGHGGFGELFRSHAFINAGNISDIDTDKSIKDNVRMLSETFRLAYGVGVVLRLGGIARLELNYVVPAKFTSEDKVNPGIQFGVGFTFI